VKQFSQVRREEVYPVGLERGLHQVKQDLMLQVAEKNKR